MCSNEGVAKIDIGVKWPSAANSAHLLNVSCTKNMPGPGNYYFYKCVPGIVQSFSKDSLGFSLRKNPFWNRSEKHFIFHSVKQKNCLGTNSPYFFSCQEAEKTFSNLHLVTYCILHDYYWQHPLSLAVKSHFQTKPLFYKQGRLTWDRHATICCTKVLLKLTQAQWTSDSLIQTCWDNCAKNVVHMVCLQGINVCVWLELEIYLHTHTQIRESTFLPLH